MVFTFAIVYILTACEKEITIKQLPYDSVLSIQCLITPGDYPKLYLNRTVPYLEPQKSDRDLFVKNAKAIINGGTEQINFKPDSVLDEFYGRFSYFYKGDKKIEADKEYTLEIQADGKIYTAGASSTIHPAKLDSVTYVQTFKDIYGEHEGIVFYLNDNPNEKNFYRYEMHREIDSTTYGLGKIKSPYLTGVQKARVAEIGRTIYSDESFNGGTFSFVIEPVFKHKDGDEAWVLLQTCDQNLFNFFDELDKQKLAQLNPFVEPVFLKTTQFENAIGVFGCYAVSDSIKFVYPE
jgi:hypothetical protein